MRDKAQEYLDLVRARCPVEEIIGAEVQLRRDGIRLKGLCPLHADSQASLVVYVENQSWHCFGCGAGGDVFAWIQARQSVDFWTAVDILAERKGIERRSLSQQERTQLEQQHAERRSLRELLTESARFYAGQLWEPLGQPARTYLHGRGFTEATLRTFSIGYAAGGISLQGHLKTKGYNAELVARAGLLGRPRPSDGLQQDFFWQRAMFPVYDGGAAVNLYGRTINPEGKPAHLYLAGRNSGLFNWDEASRHRELFLTEGIIDALSLHQAGFDNVIASYGVSGFKEEFALRLRRAGVERVYLVFDSDPEEKKAGQTAALRVSSLLAGLGIEPRIIDLGPKADAAAKLDANDYFRQHTAEEFAQLVAAAKSPPDYKQLWKLDVAEPLLEVRGPQLVFRSGSREYQIHNIETSNDGVRANITLLCNETLIHKDRVSFWSDQSRTRFAKKARGQNSDEVERELLALDTELQAYTIQKAAADEAAAAREPEMTEEEREEALVFLRDPDLLKRIVNDLTRLGYIGEDINKIVTYLIATSRKLPTPMAAVVKGQSAAGKSDLIKKVLRLMPPEEIMDLSRVTAQALFYYGPDALQHKFVVIMERAGAEGADYAIRTMQSEQMLSVITPIKNPQTGAMETREFKVKGPIAYMESTTEAQIHAENATRMFELYINETPKQTKQIHDAQREARTEAAIAAEIERERITRLHRNAQRLLKTYRVVIDYAPLLAFPSDQIRARRDNARFLDLIESVAFLHQYQREIGPLELNPEILVIRARREDYKLAYGLSQGVLTQTLDELPRPTRELLIEIKGMVENMAAQRGVHPTKVDFTRRDVRRRLNASEAFIRRHIDLLVDMDYLETSGGGQGRTTRYSFIFEGDVTRPQIKGLRSPEEFDSLCNAEEVKKGVKLP